MAKTKSESHGCTLKYNSLAPSTPPVHTDADTLLGQLTSIDGPEWSMDVVNVTTNDNTDLMEYVAAGIADGGEITVGLVLDPTDANVTAIIGYLEAGTKGVVKITFTGDLDYLWSPVIFGGLKIIPGPQDGTADTLRAELRMKVTASIGITAGP